MNNLFLDPVFALVGLRMCVREDLRFEDPTFRDSNCDPEFTLCDVVQCKGVSRLLFVVVQGKERLDSRI